MGKKQILFKLFKISEYKLVYLEHIYIEFKFDFCISVEFKICVIQDYRRLKNIKIKSHNLVGCNINTEIYKINYKIYIGEIK